jgi:hypothetical protein
MVQLLRDSGRRAPSPTTGCCATRPTTQGAHPRVSDEFWDGFDRDRLGSLEFLENKIAPQQMDGSMTFVRYVGTDLDAFLQAFDRTVIVEGTRVPSRQRGILLGKWYAEEYLKLKSARRLDKIKDAREAQGRRIAKDEELQRWVKENQSSCADQLSDPIRAGGRGSSGRPRLREQPCRPVRAVPIANQNFDERYHIFYQDLAPMLQLYPSGWGTPSPSRLPPRAATSTR